MLFFMMDFEGDHLKLTITGVGTFEGTQQQ
jgi:hypothetical protein